MKPSATSASIAPSHTPTPWHIAIYGESERAVIKRGSLSIAHVDYVDDGESNDITHANAAYIVTACNSYQAMRDALIGLLQSPTLKNNWSRVDGDTAEAIEAAEAALASLPA